MHAVFRSCQIDQIEDQLWKVELILTSDDDDDQKLQLLINYL
jgi:hypothetical protein